MKKLNGLLSITEVVIMVVGVILLGSLMPSIAYYTIASGLPGGSAPNATGISNAMLILLPAILVIVVLVAMVKEV